MTERKVRIAGTFEEFTAAWDAVLPVGRDGDWLGDAIMRENAKRCHAILQTKNLKDTYSCVADEQALAAVGECEGSAVWSAAHWLAEYHQYRHCRGMIEAGDRSDRVLTSLVLAATGMGRIQEEMWWRSGIDPETGMAREALTLSGRKFRLKSKQGAAQRRGKSAPQSNAVGQNLKTRVAAGHTVSNTARVTAAAGLGRSHAANSKLWHGHKKAGTNP